MRVPKPRRVLIIDDMESIHADYAKALATVSDSPLDALEDELFGADASAPRPLDVKFDLDFASQGLQGIEKARAALAAGEPFALAFVDVRMPPGLDGIETIVRLWDVDPRLEIVICTAYSDYSWHQMLQKLARSGQFLVLGKPFDTTVVKQMALGLTEKWHLARGAELNHDELETLVKQRTVQLSDSNVKLESEIRERGELERRLRHAQKLEALGRLVAGVAHEINNPLGFVLANLEHLQTELTDLDATIGSRIDDLRKVAQETRVGGKRIQQIVRDLKAFSATEARQAENADITEVMDFALRMARASFPSGMMVETHFEEPGPKVRANTGQLSQVFLNLLVNAAQSMAPVSADRQKLDVSIRTCAGSRLEVTVKDQGVGINTEDLPKIFDPFFTTRSVGSGTGLGLSICHGIVQALGGEIGVESSPGAGSTFTVKIPLEQLPPSADVLH